jgi:uridine phosphorylase
MTVYLDPTAPIAPDALLPGDPGRALALAQSLLERPRMCNHRRGLWGYSGSGDGGHALTIQATGIGGPSVAAVVAELAGHGVRRAVRLGTCTAVDGGPPPGSLLAAERAIALEGASRALGADRGVEPDPALHRRLVEAAAGAAAPEVIASVDVPSSAPGLDDALGPHGHGAIAVEMGTATLFALGARIGIAVASALVVAARGGESLDDEEVERRSLELGEIAARALRG